MNNSNILDTIIIGAGPAGLSAAIYAARAELKFVVIESAPYVGGMVQSSYEVDNYLGLPDRTGPELAECFYEHCHKLGCQFEEGEVIDIQSAIGYLPCERDYFIVNLTDGRFFTTKTVIAATGTTRRKLQVPGEYEFAGLGVSYCATCDGPLYKNKKVVVAGGGNAALEDALSLSRICKSVTIIHHHTHPRADKVLISRAKTVNNISFIPNSEIIEIGGCSKGKPSTTSNNSEEDKNYQQNGGISCVTVKNYATGYIFDIPCDGLFVSIGFKTNISVFDNLCAIDSDGFIKATENCVTSCPGLFVAGDIRTKQKRQIITAAADGANAVASVLKYLASAIPANYRKC